jgi:hypothetical protein
MIPLNHYNKCKNLFRQLIEANIHKCKEDIEPKEYWVERGGIRGIAYRDAFDLDVYIKDLIEQSILPSVSFNEFRKEFISGEPRNDFYLYGIHFCININEELKRILNLSLMMYRADNILELTQTEFKNLYFSIYEDKFTVKVNTIVKNFYSLETKLLNQEKVNITIQKKRSYVCVVYEITDTKRTYKNNPRDYPQTIIDISIGILRIYQNHKISYVINEVNYSPGCPKIFNIETSFPVMMQLFETKKDYVITDHELQQFKEFFEYAYSSEEQILMAIQRFSTACERESDDDRLLDLVFTLEILFGKGVSRKKRRHKVLIRLLNLISSKKEVRQTLCQKMNDLYDARNAIAHGLERKREYYTCIENLGNYQEIVRQAITAFINTMKSYKDLNHRGMVDKLDYDKRGINELDARKISW